MDKPYPTGTVCTITWPPEYLGVKIEIASQRVGLPKKKANWTDKYGGMRLLNQHVKWKWKTSACHPIAWMRPDQTDFVDDDIVGSLERLHER